MKGRPKIWIPILVVIVFVAGYLYVNKDRSSVVTSIYRNNTYGFLLDYPKALTPTTTFATYYALSNKWRALAGENEKGASVIAIPIFRVNQASPATGKPYPLYFDAEVRVGVSTVTSTCYTKDVLYSEQIVTDETINGIPFKKFPFSGAGMSQYVEVISYRTIHDNKCYVLEQIETGASYRDPSMKVGISDATLNGYYKSGEQIIKTFQFTR
jgi:hypothetical protein